VKSYREWFDREVPEATRAFMLEKWGEPEKSNIMVWRDEKGEAYFVFPTQRFGKLLLAPQPTRAGEQDPEKLYHDVALPPSHQYLAFYLWLQKTVDVHAVIHLGTHATHEWHNGKEVGFTAGDPGELFMGGVPQLYPYIVETADAILAVDTRLSDAERKARAAELVASIDRSAGDELDALATGLAGGNVAAGPGNDPVRNPSALPTGRNLYGFDPARLPSLATWAMGRKLAEDFVADFQKRKGEYPQKLAFNLWGVETTCDGCMRRNPPIRAAKRLHCFSKSET
jgi:cobalamin biosynthesis Mg chelatase CobN